MFFVTNYALAVFFCVITMFCWGSWGNTQKLAGKTWRYELFYWDYVIGVVLFALVSGLTAGSFGANSDWEFVANLKQASSGNLSSAFVGGIVFNAANILLAAAISIAGMSVAFPVGIGLALVLGVIVNYVGAPKGDATMLFAGVALIVVAILCNAFAYKIKQANEAKSNNLAKGIVLSVICGCLMAFFYRFMAATMDMDFTKAAPAAGMMSPYSAFFVFALGIFTSNFVFNTIAMRHPVSGSPITEREYFRGSFPIHLVGVFGGLVWGLGNGISLVAAGKAGAAISYGLGQGATLVSALWGILIWKEFKGSPRKATVLNILMFVLFVAGLGLIIKAGQATPKREPVKVVFDTDMYTDFDDAGALGCLHAFADEDKCEILATVACTRGCYSVAVCEVINAFYGRSEIPVGCTKEIGRQGLPPRHEFRYGDTVRKYAKWVKHPLSDSAPDANEVYRRVLAAQPDGSVVVCTVGFLTNLRRLLETKPDEVSPLDGKSLVARKVQKLVAMACRYPKGREYNSATDAESSKIVLEQWPTPIVFTDWNLGIDLYAGRAIADAGLKDNPVADIFAKSLNDAEAVEGKPSHGWSKAGRAAWDETAVLIAVEGEERYFNVERGTYRMTGEKGDDVWVPDPNGRDCRVTEKMAKAEVGKVIDGLICRGARRPGVSSD